VNVQDREKRILDAIEQADFQAEVGARRRSRDEAQYASSWRGEIASNIERVKAAPPSVGIIEQDDDHTSYAFYRGKLCWLFGSNDSCKTWIAYTVVLERLKRHESAVILDWEMGRGGVVDRLVDLGATESDLSRLLVVTPATGLSEAALRELEIGIAELPGELAIVVFDAAASSIMQSGFDANTARDVEDWVQRGPRWVATHWPTAVSLVVDHVPKEGKEPTGSRRKGDTSDAVYFVESKSRISRDEYGRTWVSVTKDRQGFHAYKLLFVFEGGGGEPWSIRAPKPGEVSARGEGLSEEDKRDMIWQVIDGRRDARTPMDMLKDKLKGSGSGSSTEISKRVQAMASEGILDYPKGQGIAPGLKFDD
jgi:hypothetical protein